MTSALAVSDAVMEDLPGLMELEMSFPEPQRWRESSWREELLQPRRLVLVCRRQSGLAAAATFSLAGDVVDLQRIVTSATARRGGLARRLVDAGIGWARDVGANRMLLEVDTTNVAAVSLYEAAGFRRISERRDYYGPGVHALVLEREVRVGEGGEQT